VTGHVVPNGFAIEVEDRGLGMSPELLAELNGRLAEAPEFDLFDSARLGMFVIARLAHRHDVQVSLRPSPYGGTTAIVLIPDALVSPAVSGTEQYSVEQIPAAEAGTRVNGDGKGTGLPLRVRQENLAPQLRDAVPSPGAGASERAPKNPTGPLSDPLDDPLDAPPLHPSPDMFSSFRAGWERAHGGEGNMS
jgi:hypothetical protein